MDPVTCCLLGICCPPEEQEKALTAWFQEKTHMGADHAREAARAVMEHFDLAPAGTLTEYIATIVAMIRHHDKKDTK